MFVISNPWGCMNSSPLEIQSFNSPLNQPVINLRRLAINSKKEFYAEATEHDWIKQIILEFDEVKAENVEEEIPPSDLSLKFSIQKKQNETFGEHVLLCGNIICQFNVECVRCLVPVHQKIMADFNICFVAEQLAEKSEYEDTLSLFIDQTGYELYFYSDNSINLIDFIYETIALNKDPFPLHDINCKGLCQFCGENLNKVACIHVKGS